jgi:hypothetical protein
MASDGVRGVNARAEQVGSVIAGHGRKDQRVARVAVFAADGGGAVARCGRGPARAAAAGRRCRGCWHGALVQQEGGRGAVAQHAGFFRDQGQRGLLRRTVGERKQHLMQAPPASPGRRRAAAMTKHRPPEQQR